MASEIIVVATIDNNDQLHKQIYWHSKIKNKWTKLGTAVKDSIRIQQRYVYVSELLYIECTCNCASTEQHHWNNGYDERTQNNIIEIMDMMKEQTRKVWNTMILIFMLTNLSKLNISHSLRYVTNEGSFKRHHEIMIKLFLVMKWFLYRTDLLSMRYR